MIIKKEGNNKSAWRLEIDQCLAVLEKLSVDREAAKLEVEKIIDSWSSMFLIKSELSYAPLIDYGKIDDSFRIGTSFPDFVNFYNHLFNKYEQWYEQFSKVSYFEPKHKEFEFNYYQIYFNLKTKTFSFSNDGAFEWFQITPFRDVKKGYNKLSETIKETTDSEIVKDELVDLIQEEAANLHKKILEKELFKTFGIDEEAPFDNSVTNTDLIEDFKVALDIDNIGEAKRIFKLIKSSYYRSTIETILIDYFNK